MVCPKCGGECIRDEVDVGVGTIFGPWGCYECGWSDDPRYDGSEGPSESQQAHPEHYVDPCGGLTPHCRIKAHLDHFGLDGDAIIKDVF